MKQKAPAPLFIFRGHSAPVNCVVVVDDHVLISADEEGRIFTWNIAAKRQQARVEAHNGPVRGLELMADNRVVSQGRDGCVKIWEVKKEDPVHLRCVATVDAGCRTFVSMCKISSTYIAMPSPANDRAVAIVDVSDEPNEKLVELDAIPAEHGLCMCVASSQNLVFAGHEDGSMAVYDWQTRSLLGVYPVTPGTPVLTCHVNDQLEGVAGGSSCALQRFSGSQCKLWEPQLQLHQDTNGVNDVSIRQDRKIIAVAGWDHRVTIFKANGHRSTPLCILKTHTKSVNAVVFSSQFLFSGGADGRIAMWKIY